MEACCKTLSRGDRLVLHKDRMRIASNLKALLLMQVSLDTVEIVLAHDVGAHPGLDRKKGEKMPSAHLGKTEGFRSAYISFN